MYLAAAFQMQMDNTGSEIPQLILVQLQMCVRKNVSNKPPCFTDVSNHQTLALPV